MEDLGFHDHRKQAHMIVWSLAVLGASVAAQCILPAEEQLLLTNISQRADPARGILLGMALFDAHNPPYRNCLAEARQAFFQAKIDMSASDNITMTHRDLLNAVDGFLLLCDAGDRLAVGDLAGAREILKKVLGYSDDPGYANGWLQQRAIIILGDLIRDKPHAREWASLLPTLKVVSKLDWRARGLYADHLLSLGQADQVGAEVSRDLSSEIDEQKRLELITLLSYIRIRQNRLGEAILLLNSIETEMSRHMLDPSFRYNYLHVCALAWHASYKRDGDLLTFQILERIQELKSRLARGG